MDKKAILIIAAVVIIALAGSASWHFMQQMRVPEIEDIKELVPVGVMMFVEVKDLKETWSKIKNTELFKLIDESKKKAQRQSNRPTNKKSLVDTKVKKFLESEMVSAFGRLGVVAFYVPDSENFKEDEPPEILFITRIDKRTKFEKNLLETFLRAQSLKERKDKISKEKYLGFNISIIDVDEDTDVAYLILRDVLVLSDNLEIVKKVIDIIKNDDPSFWQDERFQLAYGKKSAVATMFAYVDIEIFQDSFLSLIKHKKIKQDKLKDFRDFSDIFKAYGLPEFEYGTFELDVYDGLHIGYSIGFNASTMSEELREFWSATRLNQDMGMIKLMPRDTILLSLGASQEKAQDYYRYIGESLEKLESEELKKEIIKRRKQTEDYFRKVGYDYESEVIPLIKETAFALLGLEQVSLMPQMPPTQGSRIAAPSITFPFPRSCFLIRVSDKAKAENVVSKSLESFIAEIQEKASQQKSDSGSIVITPGAPIPGPGLPLGFQPQAPNVSIEEEIYEGIEITRLFNIIPLFPFLSPGYCFVGDYLVLSLNDSALKDIIDVHKGRRSSFDSNIDFIKFSASVPEEITGLFYMDTLDLSKDISKLKNTMKLFPKLSGSGKFQEGIDVLSDVLIELNIIEGYMVADEEYFRGDIFIKIKGL